MANDKREDFKLPLSRKTDRMQSGNVTSSKILVHLEKVKERNLKTEINCYIYTFIK